MKEHTFPIGRKFSLRGYLWDKKKNVGVHIKTIPHTFPIYSYLNLHMKIQLYVFGIVMQQKLLKKSPIFKKYPLILQLLKKQLIILMKKKITLF